MKKLLLIMLVTLSLVSVHAATYQLKVSPGDVFTISDNNEWNVAVTRLRVLDVAEVTVTPKDRKSFMLMLYFMRDTEERGLFDTPDKMKMAVMESSQKYVPDSAEKKVNLERIDIKGSYGFKACFTDADLAKQKDLPVPAGQFMYVVRGMVRLTVDTALGFRLCTNDLNSEETKAVERYILSFVKLSDR
ncbi:MAG: hypothetical protein WCV67_12300 [Victivallaceae bacterium]|jgi:hypothetical protein